MLYVIAQSGMKIIPVQENDIIFTVKNDGVYYVRREKEGRPGSDALGVYHSKERVKNIIFAMTEQMASTIPDRIFEMPQSERTEAGEKEENEMTLQNSGIKAVRL